jgi:hypothetical protein
MTRIMALAQARQIDVILVSELTRFCDQWEMQFFHETQFWDIGNLLIIVRWSPREICFKKRTFFPC